MPRRVDLKGVDGFVFVALPEEITVRQRTELGKAITDSISATYALSSLARIKVIELEKELTPAERNVEKAMDKDARERAQQFRANAAELIVLRDLPESERETISQHQRVRIRCYLRQLFVNNTEIEPLPSTNDDFDNLTAALFDALVEACDDELPDVPDAASTPDNQADPKVGTPA